MMTLLCCRSDDIRPTAELMVGTKKAQCLFDTGSQVTLVADWFLASSAPTAKLSNFNTRLRTANNGCVTVLGETNLPYQIGDRRIEHTTVVASDVPYTCVIGADLMERLGLEIDMRTKTIKLRPDYEDSRTKDNEDPDIVPAVLTRNQYLEPNQQKLVTVKVARPTREIDTICFDSSNEQLAENNICTISETNRIKVMAYNDSDYPLKLHKGLQMGQCYSMEHAQLFELKNLPKIAALFSQYNQKRSKDAHTSAMATHEQSYEEILHEKLQKVPSNVRPHYEQLMSVYQDVFSKNPDDVGDCGNTVQQEIRLIDPNKIACTPPYRLPHHLLPVAHEYVQKLLNRDIIRPSTSPFSSPLMLVKKPGQIDPTRPLVEQFRVVHDYRRLNANTIKDAYPMQNLHELIDEVSQGRLFTIIDLSQGFWNQRLSPKDREKTAFGVPGLGHFEYNRSAQGLCNSPSAFQRLLDFVTRGLVGVYVYIDDVVIVSKTHEEHMRQLKNVFERFRYYGLKCRARKLQLAVGEVNYLGYNISTQHGIRPGLLKTQAIERWQPPKDIKQIKLFLGLCSFFR